MLYHKLCYTYIFFFLSPSVEIIESWTNVNGHQYLLKIIIGKKGQSQNIPISWVLLSIGLEINGDRYTASCQTIKKEKNWVQNHGSVMFLIGCWWCCAANNCWLGLWLYLKPSQNFLVYALQDIISVVVTCLFTTFLFYHYLSLSINKRENRSSKFFFLYIMSNILKIK